MRRPLFSRSFRWAVGILVLATCAPSASRADEAAAALQSALKTKGYYYGAPDGTFDLETHNAIRRFQIHEGLPVNGELDGPTAKALGVAAPGKVPAAVSAPARSPVARGESVGPPQEPDREFLQRLEEQSPTERIAVHPTPGPASPVAPPPPAPAVIRPSIPDAEVDAFVSRYLVAGASPDLEAEVGLYADAVDYFNDGRVNRGFIRRDTANYRRRWPRRDYLLEGKPTVVRSSPDGGSLTVRFRLRYRVQAGLQSAAGRTESTMELQRTPGGSLTILAIKETVVPRS